MRKVLITKKQAEIPTGKGAKWMNRADLIKETCAEGKRAEWITRLKD